MKLKKILASILCLAMVLSTMGTVAFAEATVDGGSVADGSVDLGSVAYVSDLDELLEALDGEATTIIMENDIKGTAELSNAYGKTGINILNGETLDGNGFTLTITGADGTWDTAINTTGGIIKNLTIDRGFRGIFVNHNSEYSELVVLENVVIDGPTYTISCDQGKYQGLRAIDSTFNGWTSYAATIGNVEFINCNFGEGAGYDFCRPYAPSNFVGCDFSGDYEIDPRATSNLESCTRGGEDITEENLSDLVTSNVEKAGAKNEFKAYIPGEGGFATLQDAINAVNESATGDYTIKLLADIEEDVTFTQNEGIDIVLDGNNKNFDGTIYIHGKSRYTGAETLTIQNVNFVTDEGRDFISSNTTVSAERYAHNVTVKDCTFTSNTTEDVVGMRFRQAYNIDVVDCTFENMHSAMWATGVSNGLDFDGITTTNCQNGISVGTSIDVTVKNSQIEAYAEGGYGVRADGEGAYNLNVENCEIDAFAPVLVRKVNKDASVGYNLTVTDSTLDASNPYGYEIVVTGEDYDAPDKELVEPKEISVTLDKAYSLSSYVAFTGGKVYTTLEAAIAAAQDDDVIDLLGKDITFTGAIPQKKSLTIKNGTINANNPATFNVFSGKTLTFEAVELNLSNFTSSWLYPCGNNTISFIDSVVNISNGGNFINSDLGSDKVVIKNTKINAAGIERLLVNVDVDMDKSSITVNGTGDNALRNVYGTIIDTDISINGAGDNGLKNSQDKLLTIDGSSKVVITGSKAYDLWLLDSADVTVGEKASLEVLTSNIEGESAVSGDNFVSKADSIYVQYKKVDVDANGNDTVEGSDEYEIVLAGADEEKINELASADLTFNFVGTPVKGGKMDYTVAPAKGVTLTQLGDRFMFNYNGKDKYEETGLAIVIGTITIDGYGSYTLATADSDKNAVYATEIRDNIVDGFTPAAGLVINTDLAANDGMVGEITDGVVMVPTRNLSIKVDFPNAVVDQKIAYQDMTVVISGSDLEENITIALGSDATKVDLTIANKEPASYEAKFVNGAYEIDVLNALTKDTSYTVTVSGAGYRTARYTVTMTNDKVLNFWNNVKDNDTVVEVNKDSSEAKVTFLAGDIVKDNNINIYDLSAVVSYFGTEDCVNSYPEYAKYDLNRDGVIDSKDVAYVLVSWNN